MVRLPKPTSPHARLASLLKTIGNSSTLTGAQQDQLNAFTSPKPGALPAALIAADFNHVLVLKWWLDHVASSIAALPDRCEKLSEILRFRESIASVPTATEPCFNLPSLKSTVLAAVDECFRFEVIRRLSTANQYGSPKIATSLSVAELAVLFKMLFAQGVFRTTNVREVLRFAVKGFGSKRQDEFSLRNLSKEFYGPSQASAASVRALLLNMVDTLNRQFFPVISVVLLNGIASGS